MTIRPVNDQDEPGQPIVGQLRNVSLAGLYCTLRGDGLFKPNDRVICELSVPRDLARQFPFTRLHSRGWILRVDAVPAGRRAGENPTHEPLVGVAIAFASNATALATFE